MGSNRRLGTIEERLASSRPKLYRADTVRCRASGHLGLVRRVARDGTWADVRWQGGWSKRMKKVSALELMPDDTPVRIPIRGGGYAIIS